MEMRGWLLRAYDGKEHGPVSVSTLKQWINENRADENSLVLAPGETAWRTVRDFPELCGYAGPDVSELMERNKRLQEDLSMNTSALQREREERRILEERLKEKDTLLMEKIAEPPIAREELRKKLASLETGIAEKDVFSHHVKMILTLYDIIKQTERDIVSELQSLLSQIKMEKLRQMPADFSSEIRSIQAPPRMEQNFETPRPPRPVFHTETAHAAAPKEDRLINIFLILSLFLMITLLGYILTKYFIL